MLRSSLSGLVLRQREAAGRLRLLRVLGSEPLAVHLLMLVQSWESNSGSITRPLSLVQSWET